MFTKHGGNVELLAFLVCHVDDVLFKWEDDEVLATEMVLVTFRDGEIEKQAQKTPIICTGGILERHDARSWEILLSKIHYANDLPMVDVAQFVQHGEIIDPRKLRPAQRQVSGSLIWLRQTRPDIGFDITKIATDSGTSCTDADTSMATLMLYNHTVRFVKDYDPKLLYITQDTLMNSFSNLWRRGQMRRLVLFVDAGFGSLTGSRSIEVSVTVLAELIPRGGFITCHGTLSGHRCAEIQRVCKSSVAAEGGAALTADQALWMLALLREIATGTYNIRHVAPPSGFPLPDPLVPPPTDDEVKWQCEGGNPKRHISWSPCTSCRSSMSSASLILAAEDFRNRRIMPSNAAPALLFRPLVLADCCSLYSAVLRIQPTSQEKCAKLIPNRLRGFRRSLDLAFAENARKLGDVEPNMPGRSDCYPISCLLSF